MSPPPPSSTDLSSKVPNSTTSSIPNPSAKTQNEPKTIDVPERPRGRDFGERFLEAQEIFNSMMEELEERVFEFKLREFLHGMAALGIFVWLAAKMVWLAVKMVFG